MKKVFNERQLMAIDLLAQGGKTYIEVADAVGVHADTLREWRRDPEFQDRVRDLCRELLKESEPFLYKTALKQVGETGSYQHIKLLLERLARLEDISEGRGPAYDVMFTWRKNNDSPDTETN